MGDEDYRFKSTTFPRMTNALNSFHIMVSPFDYEIILLSNLSLSEAHE